MGFLKSFADLGVKKKLPSYSIFRSWQNVVGNRF